MIEVTCMLFFFVLIHFVSCLSSPGNHQHDKPSSPADDFFNFDNEPFAKQLAETYSAKPHSSFVSKDVTINNSDIQKDDNGARRTDKPYQYAPRKVRSFIGWNTFLNELVTNCFFLCSHQRIYDKLQQQRDQGNINNICV